jgi:hypothetical protein
VNGVFTFPWIAPKQPSQYVQGEHAGQYPAAGREVDAAADQGDQLRHCFSMFAENKKGSQVAAFFSTSQAA